jgi:tetratricopeptide (TPR) repeat protein
MRTAVTLATERGLGRDATVQYNNLAEATLAFEGPARALDVFRTGIDFAERRGIAEHTLALACSSNICLLLLGKWDEAVALAKQAARDSETAGSTLFLLWARAIAAWIDAYRGVASPELADPGVLVEPARESRSAEYIGMTFTVGALTALVEGRVDVARALVAECAQVPHIVETVEFAVVLPEFIRVAIGCDLLDLSGQIVRALPPISPLRDHALTAAGAALAEARGDYEGAATRCADAAERWRAFGAVFERAQALLGEGRCLLALGRPGAEQPLREARDIFAGLGARPLVADADALLERTIAATS